MQVYEIRVLDDDGKVAVNAEQIKALKSNQSGESVRAIVIQRLKGLGLVTQTQGVWSLTDEGLMRIGLSR